MHIEHIALWTVDIERLRGFYETYFDATAGPRYVNAAKKFTSYFLCFESGARLEIMSTLGTVLSPSSAGEPRSGYAHIAVAMGSRARVDAMTARLRAAGFPVVDGPRITGDGYYESVVLDPDGNRLELAE